MILLDAQALIAFVLGEPAMEQVRSILREGSTAITTANLGEALDVLTRREKLPSERVAAAIEPLLEGPLVPIPVDVWLARRAAEIRVEHYHRRDCSLSLADSILLAAARSADKVATADGAVITTAAKLGIETIRLP